MKKRRNLQKTVLVIALLTAILFLVWLSNVIGSSSVEGWQTRTSPLTQDVIKDLCSKFNLSREDPLCIPNQEVFAPDFYPLIEKSFVKGSTNFQDVQVLIADYLVYLDDPSPDKDSTSFDAWYDFHGDGITALVFVFTGDHQNNKLQGYVEFFWEPGDFKAGEQ